MKYKIILGIFVLILISGCTDINELNKERASKLCNLRVEKYNEIAKCKIDSCLRNDMVIDIEIEENNCELEENWAKAYHLNTHDEVRCIDENNEIREFKTGCGDFSGRELEWEDIGYNPWWR